MTHNILKISLYIISCIFLTACQKLPPPQEDGIMALSMSSNGQYIIATTLRKKLILFNTVKHTSKVLSKQANIYSAYFIKNTNDFIWQNDKNNTVYIESVTGKQIRHFSLDVPSYGEVMTSNLKTYICSDENFNLIFEEPHKTEIKQFNGTGFQGAGKVMNLDISSDNSKLLISGLNTREDLNTAQTPKTMKQTHYPLESLTLWNINSKNVIQGYPGNVFKTFATISPNGNNIVAGDEDTHLRVWDIKHQRFIFQAYDLYLGKDISTGPGNNDYRWDKSVLKIFPPKGFSSQYNGGSPNVVSLKYIDKNHYLLFSYDIAYAILYNTLNPAPIKYLKLSSTPFPAVNAYERNLAIDSSWHTHMLVIAHAIDPGITVYQYFPKTKRLKVIWNTKTLHVK